MPRKTYNSGGPNAEDRALEVWSDVIIDKLEHLGKDAKWEQPWFDKEGLAWPKNMSGREYNGMNAVILKMMAEKNKWDVPVYATFNRLTSLNYQTDKMQGPVPMLDKDGSELPRVMVNKGEKSTPVGLTTFTVVNKETKEKIPYEDYRELEPKDKEKFNVYPKLMIYNVFNVGQTNLKEARPELYEKLKEMSVGPEAQRDRDMWSLPEFDAMVDEQKWICPIDIKDEGKCFYSISRDRIQMVPKEKFKNGEAYFTNCLHEMSHSTTSVLNRIDTVKFGNDEYAKEELHAELSAALVASKYGAIKNLKSDTLPYVKSWLDSLHENPKFIKTVLGDVKKSSGLILDRLDKMKIEMEQRLEAKVDVKERQGNVQGVGEAANDESDARNLKEDKDKLVAKGMTAVQDSQKPNGRLEKAGTYDIPEWALNYLENNDASGLSDDEQSMVDKFVEKNFPNGFMMLVDFDNPKEFNNSPAFGERNKYALVNRGESPYLAVKTFSVQFFTERRQLENHSNNKTVNPLNSVSERQLPQQSNAAANALDAPNEENEVKPHHGFHR